MSKPTGFTKAHAQAADWTTERLDSWKEIASFFHREVRTVQLWEKSEGLPIRRQHHKKLGSVYAYRREVEAWWIARSAASSGYDQRPTEALLQVPVPSSAPAELEARKQSRILAFPFEVIHSIGNRNPQQHIVDRFAEGLKEDLILELSRVDLHPLFVASSALPSPDRSTPAFMSKLTTEFGSDFFLTGSIRYAYDRVRVTVQLVRSRDAVCVWSDRFDASLKDVLNAQAELACKISEALPMRRITTISTEACTPVTEHEPAHDACMLGVHFWKLRRGPDLWKALGYFQEAIALNPNCADAYAGLANTYVSLSYYHLVPARKAAAMAREAVDHALKLRASSLFVRNAEINLLTHCIWDWHAAERACQSLVDAGNTNSQTLQLYASLMINLGRHDEAINLSLYAHRLDPLSDLTSGQVSFAYFYAGDYGSALNFSRRAVELQPRSVGAHVLLGRTEAERGNWDDAIAAFLGAQELSDQSPSLYAHLAYAYAGSGDTTTANTLLSTIGAKSLDVCFPAYDVAAVHAILNRKTEALEHLHRAHEMREMKMIYMRHDPRFTSLRTSVPFQRIASSIY